MPATFSGAGHLSGRMLADTLSVGRGEGQAGAPPDSRLDAPGVAMGAGHSEAHPSQAHSLEDVSMRIFKTLVATLLVSSALSLPVSGPLSS